MVKERGVIMPIIRNFINSLKPKASRRHFVGEDYNGTKYYEDLNQRNRRGRSFEPKDPENFQEEIPAEWEAWLRYRRLERPSDEEVQANYNLMIMKRRNAAELEKKYKENAGRKIEDNLPKEKLSFPTYEEYKDFGQNYKPKSDK
ncbi:NADH dehydrogenase [ubiquinone] 1 alpha subcomplex assembly factor 2 [Microplitis demolitor]|uniref:NADH dehydrogenase [ubiquinone] 1 alpha subcomplex assembly factor 2 n=1 Tax=Microplitis demolitor TaxID=69319 RepID=UPI00043FFE7C|nr:NADH dehydrogenase [ubiquinone] 1 alpha subcomplex assembly factor 2 [Microplitis demolitor]